MRLLLTAALLAAACGPMTSDDLADTFKATHPEHELVALANDDGGAPIAFSLEDVDGPVDAPEFPGLPVLAHAYRWDGRAWQLVESAPSTAYACDALGVDALDMAKLLHRSGDDDLER